MSWATSVICIGVPGIDPRWVGTDDITGRLILPCEETLMYIVAGWPEGLGCAQCCDVAKIAMVDLIMDNAT
ncbi:MAG: hypothetical protein A2Y72_07220 [Chloroflexi bacterium RBG_13_53_26]|nr:MAG: hypothetical protein A2Y72_07220 [Chloroflexi bacterium RBG_13_53_26]